MTTEPLALEPPFELRAPAASCASCAAPVIWCVTRNGRRIPVDPKPVALGNLVLGGDPEVPTALVVERDDPRMPRYESHFVTCEQAVKWRGSRR